MPKITGFSVEVSLDVIRQAQQGDIDAFEQIYHTYAEACYSLSWRICGQEVMAQDLVQDVFIKVINKINNYRADGVFAGWLRKIVVREAINKIKAETKLHLVTDDDLSQQECTDLFDCNWLESCLDLETLTNQLSVTSRAVFMLHEVEGYNHKEIANFFNKSESFSKVTLSRAYIALRQSVTSQESTNAFNR